MDVLEEKRTEAGPSPLYAQSWTRAIDLIRRPLRAEETSPYRVSDVLTDGAGALALALYLVAAADSVTPETVTRAQVEALLPREAIPLEFSDGVVTVESRSTLPGWEARLRALGHDIDGDAGSDPVTMHWQTLRTDITPPDDAPDAAWDDATLRVGYRFISGLRVILAPRYADDLAF